MNSFGWQGKDENQARTSFQNGSGDGVYRTNRGAAYSRTARNLKCWVLLTTATMMEACQGKSPHIGVVSPLSPLLYCCWHLSCHVPELRTLELARRLEVRVAVRLLRRLGPGVGLRA